MLNENSATADTVDALSKFQSQKRFSMHDIFREIDKRLRGRLLTLVDATFTDQEQRKAFKDIVSNNISQTLSNFQDMAWDQDKKDGPESTEDRHASKEIELQLVQ